MVGNQPPVGFKAYDGGGVAAPDGSPTLEIKAPVALNYLASARRFELGLARAFITGAIEIHGDLYDALKALWMLEFSMPKVEMFKIFTSLGGLKLLKRPPIPDREAKVSGHRHSKTTDAEAIAHHYDVGNDFYEILLGESMAYTCAVYPSDDATLEKAQYDKHDLVARKLDLKPGMRLLDVGCGWGGMVMHAAKHYGVKALGVTLSRQQAEWADKAINERGLSDLAEVRYLDYRDVPEGDFDAVSSIGLTEHIGRSNLASYFRSLYDKLKVGGRLLNHCITKPDSKGEAITRGGFIERYIFPNGELSGPGPLMTHMHDAGFEVCHEENLRGHYALTLAAWVRNLERRWDDVLALVGEETARAWRLYLVGSRLGFEHNGIQLHQMLGVKLDEHGTPAMPLRPTW